MFPRSTASYYSCRARPATGSSAATLTTAATRAIVRAQGLTVSLLRKTAPRRTAVQAFQGGASVRSLHQQAAATGNKNAPSPADSHAPPPPPPPLTTKQLVDVKKVLVLGSGGLTIGQAGEFDFSGSQAIKALKAEGISTVLINANVATIQTDAALADTVYYLPLTPEYVADVIAREKPDGILLTFGGQTALNCGIALDRAGVLREHGVQVLGTPVNTLVTSEDRDLFARALREIDVPMAPSVAVCSVEEALAAAQTISYPVIVRSAYALGGLGSGFAHSEEELRDLAGKALALAPQILVERSMQGWKEVEYEVVRDAYDNCVTVCNMENFDPLGVHTGDSIVVAPSQTLTDAEYHMLREAAIRIVRHLGVVGECNVQYALNPNSKEFAVIEVNARLSRSSALASKATGYPLAYIAAKLALGHALPDLRNAVTGARTTANFEPSLDYCVVKVPRWDLSKFGARVDRRIGSAMKSVGEVMAIGGSFEEALAKALRMVQPGSPGFEPPPPAKALPSGAATASNVDKSNDERNDAACWEKFEAQLRKPTDQRMTHLAIAVASSRYTVDQLHQLTRIDRWFLHKLMNMHNARERVRALGSLESLDAEELRHAKINGLSDIQIASLVGTDEAAVRTHRKAKGVLPAVRRIDTLAGEYPTETNYLYMTYTGKEHDVPPGASVTEEGGPASTVILGSGVYRIGSSVEFDWCAVSAVREVRAQQKKKHQQRQLQLKTSGKPAIPAARAVMINCNPETVSTDYDECDALYFEEGSLERVLDVYEHEHAAGVIVSVGGQGPQNIALELQQSGARVLGTDPTMIDRAEDRFRFAQVLDSIDVAQPRWRQLTSVADAQAFAESVGYPVLVRPSYVLSGAAMAVAHTPADLERVLARAAAVSPKHPVVVTEFVQGGARELDVDAVAVRGDLVAHVVSEHVEPAGVHSGDASLVVPARGVLPPLRKRLRNISAEVARALQISGPFNMQLIVRGDGTGERDVLVIECNLRAARSVPFVSKALGTNLARLATRAILSTAEDPTQQVKESAVTPLPESFDDPAKLPYVCAKVAQFSWTRIPGADPVASVEMGSTGEVAVFALDPYDAFLTALEATHGFKVPDLMVPIDSDASTGAQQPSALVTRASSIDPAALKEVSEALASAGLKVIPATQGDTATVGAATQDTMESLWASKGTAVPTLETVRARARDQFTSARVGLVVSLADAAAPVPPKGKHGSALTAEDRGYLLRRAAVDLGVPVVTNAAAAKMLAKALAKRRDQMQRVQAVATADKNAIKAAVRKPLVRSWREWLKDAGRTYA